MKRVQQGFTLIELMIVVAIVGILAAVAIPAYRDYTIRSKVSEVAAALGACKTSVSEYYAAKGSFASNASVAGCSEVATQYMGGMTVSGSVLTATVSTNTGVASACNLVLTGSLSSNDITAWVGSTTCTAKYVPATFR